MECKKCGTQNQEHAKFCSGCGVDLSLQNAGEGLDMNAQQYAAYTTPQQNPNYGQNYNPNQNYNPDQNYNQAPNYNYNPNQTQNPNYNYTPAQPQNPNYNYNPNQPQNSNYGYNPYQDPNTGRGLAIAALVLGIVSFFCFPIITGVLGIIFGCMARTKGCRSGMATAGIVCGAIGLGLWLIMLILGFSFFPFM